jgi:hypothetical protein
MPLDPAADAFRHRPVEGAANAADPAGSIIFDQIGQDRLLLTIQPTTRAPRRTRRVGTATTAGVFPQANLERLRKPQKPEPRRRGSVNRYGRRAASRFVVGSRRTVPAQFNSTTERWTAARAESRVSDRHCLRPFAVAFPGRCCRRNSAADLG